MLHVPYCTVPYRTFQQFKYMYGTVRYSTKIIILDVQYGTVPYGSRKYSSGWLNGASAKSMHVRFLLLSFCFGRLDFTHSLRFSLTFAHIFPASPQVIGVCSCSEGGVKR